MRMRLPMMVEEVRDSPKRMRPKMIAKRISVVPRMLPIVASRYLKPEMTVRLAMRRAMA